MALRTSVAVIIIIVASVLSACRGPSARVEKEAHRDSNVVAHETRRAWEGLTHYTFAEKAVFLEKAEAALQRVERGVSDFQIAAKDAFSEDPGLGQVNEDLRLRGEAVRRSLGEVRASTPETWDEVKSRFFMSVAELRKAVEGAVTKLDR